MKELRISKYSKAWFMKREGRLIIFTIILFWLMPVLFGTFGAFVVLKNIKLSIVFGLIAALDIFMLFYMASTNENYDDYIYRLISKQKRKQDRKWRKWLI